MSAACPVGSFPATFDVANPEAVRWARTQSARLVTDITASARSAIRRLVATAVEEGVAPRDLARMIRDVVGLTERDALAVLRRNGRLAAQGRPAAQVARMSRRYADRLHARRALTIARTETMGAANAGQQELWRQAVDKRLLSRTMHKVWITADPCPLCAPLEGTHVPVLEPFPGGGNPPRHPNCRCTIGLITAAEVAARRRGR